MHIQTKCAKQTNVHKGNKSLAGSIWGQFIQEVSCSNL